jgi:thiol-disulfide isomerase/thioredoxin
MLCGLNPLKLCAAVVLSAACSRPLEGPPASAPSPLQSQQLPEFRRTTVRGETFDTKASKDRVMVVKFFAEHCVPCRRTLPAAEALHRDYPEVTFVGVSEDESVRAVEQQVRTYGLTFPVVLDQGNVIAGRFRVSELPAAFVTDRQGRIAWVAGPGQTDDDLRRAVERFSR